VECDPSVAAARNVHKRSEEEVRALLKSWESTPQHLNRVDFSCLLQDDEIQEVTMTDVDQDGAKVSKVRRRRLPKPVVTL